MQFSDKLDFLMRITNTTNKELSQAISVDRSLISLLRTGKRKYATVGITHEDIAVLHVVLNLRPVVLLILVLCVHCASGLSVGM